MSNISVQWRLSTRAKSCFAKEACHDVPTQDRKRDFETGTVLNIWGARPIGLLNGRETRDFRLQVLHAGVRFLFFFWMSEDRSSVPGFR